MKGQKPMTGEENGNGQKVESESIVAPQLKPGLPTLPDGVELPPEVRLQAFNQELGALQQKYGVQLGIQTEQVAPGYVVAKIALIPRQ